VVSDEVKTVRNDEKSRYEGWLDGRLVTVVEFVRDGPVLTVTHTGTEPPFRGQELAATVTRAALEDIRQRSEQVRPYCPFTLGYLDDHPEFADLRV
jgi:predicted GNAT family acetyltransferase